MKSWSGIGFSGAGALFAVAPYPPAPAPAPPAALSWPEEWKDDALDGTRRCVGSPLSCSVGCQSIGCMRSSNWDEGLNFHLRMMVHMSAVPPMQEAITMSMVIAVWEMDELPDFLDVSELAEAVAAAAETELKTVFTAAAEDAAAASEDADACTKLTDCEVSTARVVCATADEVGVAEVEDALERDAVDDAVLVSTPITLPRRPVEDAAWRRDKE